MLEVGQHIRIHGVPSRDPRGAIPLPERDYAALAFIGAWYQVAQYQLEDAIFSGRSPTVTSRAVRRLHHAGCITIERWNRIGLNLLRLTSRGRSMLLERAVAETEIFVPEKAVALKDLAHHLWIVDTGLMLTAAAADLEVTPCWALRRRLAALRPAAIPDVLALGRSNAGTDTALAVEVDLGGERLKNVFVPKLVLLRDTLTAWAGDQPAAIIVLTVGDRRRAALEAAIAARPHPVPIIVLPLPKQPGRPGLARLRMSLHSTLCGADGMARMPDTTPDSTTAGWS
jgi:hypothetical protein